MRALLFTPAIFIVACSASGSSFIEVPSTITSIAWLQLSPDGAIVDASPLMSVDDARVWAIDDASTIVFVGFDTALASRASDAKLRQAAECERLLPAPSWSHGADGPVSVALPPLTAPWLEELCANEQEELGVECEPCGSGCNGELEVYSAAVGIARDGRGIARLSSNSFAITGPPDQIAFVNVPNEGLSAGAVELVRIETAPLEIDSGLAFDGTLLYVPSDTSVFVIDPAGGTRSVTTASRHVRIAGQLGGPIIIWENGGPASELVASSTIAVPRPDLPEHITDLVVDNGIIAVLTELDVRVFGFDTWSTIPLPDGFDATPDPSPDGGPRIGLADGVVVVAAERFGALRWDETNRGWTSLAWSNVNLSQARAFAGFAGGILIGGRGENDGGNLVLSLPGENCSAYVRSPVSNLSVRPGERSAWAITSGRNSNPLLIEVRAP